MNRSLAFALTLSALFAGACAQPPEIQFVTPDDGSAVAPDDAVTFTVFVDGDFRLIDPNTVSTNANGEGHWHLNLVTGEGVQTLAMTATTAVTVDLGDLALPSGLAIFQAELRNNDHSVIEDTDVDVIELVIQ